MLALRRAAHDLWRRGSRLGTADRSPEEQRYIMAANRLAMMAIAIAASFVLAYALAGPRYWPGVAMNGAGGALSAGILGLNAIARPTAARHFSMFVGNVYVAGVSMLFGTVTGFHYYFFAIFGLSFLVLSRDEWPSRALFSSISVALFLYFEHGFSAESALLSIAPGPAIALNLASTISMCAMLAGLLYLFQHDVARAEREVAKEHARSERLLLNVLPSQIAARLKEGEEPIADACEDAVVLFADIVGFTPLSEKLPPDELVRLLDRVFSGFDELAVEHGLEKIKTIGDAYMVAGGLLDQRGDHVERAAQMALEMRELVEQAETELDVSLEIRLGMHAGPVVAGVIGRRKFIYDLWGDTVNTASRMEAYGLPGEIQVTESMGERLRDHFELRERGAIPIKGKGEMKTYLLGRSRHGSGRRISLAHIPLIPR